MMGFGLLCIVFVVILVAVLVGWLPQGNQTTGRISGFPGDTPREILKKRYAKGEISKQEFEQIREDLK